FTLYLNGKPAEIETVKDHLTGSIGSKAPLSVGNDALGKPYRGSMDDLRIYGGVLAVADVEQLAIHQPARASILILPKKRAKSQAENLRDYFLTRAAPPDIQKIWTELRDLQHEKEELDWTVPTVDRKSTRLNSSHVSISYA